jgi:hypothetical protein
VALDSHIGLLVAALDLELVQLLRDAIRTTALAGAKTLGVLEPAATFEPRERIEPEPYIEPRKRIEPTPYFEPREHIRPRAVVEPPAVVLPPCDCDKPREAKPIVFQPPWKVMPWENPPQPALKVKVIKLKPDIVRTGSLIDCFI